MVRTREMHQRINDVYTNVVLHDLQRLQHRSPIQYRLRLSLYKVSVITPIIRLRAPQTLLRAPQTLLRAPQILLRTPHIRLRAPRIQGRDFRAGYPPKDVSALLIRTPRTIADLWVGSTSIVRHITGMMSLL